ncbi:hypothetical protein BsWGS_03876 [Bradybaena similaris]
MDLSYWKRQDELDVIATMISEDPVPSLTFIWTTPFLGNTSGISDAINNNFNYIDMTLSPENMNTTPSDIAPDVPLQWGMLGLTLIVVCTAGGNVLVCLAVCWEKRLQNMTNYFLMSLAIADLLVSLLVMPLGMVVEIFGHFPMNPEVCVLWAASDVLMCTASIWHMCTMSMDRYFTLKYPMRYGRNKTRRMVAGKILFVWVVSLAISCPVCIYGFIDTSSIFSNGECVPTMKNFVFYGSIFAFYIPLLIMIITYVLTIRILWKNQQRMRYIDRSDLKPRLAQLTAQCTGLAIPKILTNIKKVSRSPSTPVSLSRVKGERQLLSPGTSVVLNNRSCGNINSAVCEADFSENGENGGEKKYAGATYLTTPSLQMLTSRSPSPLSAQLPMYSDTEESESEPSYFNLLYTNQSCRSLYTPISQTTSEKSLHRRLQKKQLLQQQQQELHLLRQEYHQQRQLLNNYQETTAPKPLPSPNKDTDNKNGLSKVDCSGSASTPMPPVLSPLFDENTRTQPHLCQLNRSCPKPKVPNTSSTNETPVTTGKKLSKKKRFSKRCKKRRSSLTQNSEETDHLKVPGQACYRLGVSSKQPAGHSVLVSAVSDTQVSKAGRSLDPEEETYPDVSSFHLSHRNLNKDYKSLEWDRRYFQIQEEMDLCLQGEFGRCDRRQPKQERSSDSKEAKEIKPGTGSDPEQKTLLKPEVSLPIYLADPLSAHHSSALPNLYTRSAPNSPLNRRNLDFIKLTSSSDDEREDNASDKNDDEDNDTSGSSNSDVITIRLQPPTPKLKSSNTSNCIKNNAMIGQTQANKIHSRSESLQDIINVNIKIDEPPTETLLIETDHEQNGFPCFVSNSDNASSAITTTNSNNTIDNGIAITTINNHTNSLKNGISLHNLSPAGSPLQELVISSEGEMTLDETDDTLDESSGHQQIKLRRPRQVQTPKYKIPKKHHAPKNELVTHKYVKSKRPSFRNTFRIHKGKTTVKHILSKKTATNEKKASKVLGIIFLVFVVLWTPFFAVNILNTMCESCMRNVSKEIMSLFLWMGYVASLANPIIYTMFNTAFRRTFIKILTCKIQRTCRIKTSDTHYMSYTTMLASERRNTMTVVLRDESR